MHPDARSVASDKGTWEMLRLFREHNRRVEREVAKALKDAGTEPLQLKRAVFAKLRKGIGLAKAIAMNDEMYGSAVIKLHELRLKAMRVALSQHRYARGTRA